MRTDEELMAAYQAGEARAFDEIFRRYTPLLIGFFSRRCKRAEDCRDLAQQTFLHLHRNREVFRSGQLLRPWLFTIARNAMLDDQRRRARRPEHFTEMDTHADAIPTAVSGLSTVERIRALSEAVARLPGNDRVLVTKHWLDERSFEEIAAQSGRHSGTLRVRAHRACVRMKGWIDPVHASA